MKLFVSVIASFICVCCAAQPDNLPGNAPTRNGYILKGNLKGAEDKKILLVEKSFYKDHNQKDSVIADKKGNFIFEGKLGEPAFYYIAVESKNGLKDFYLENSELYLSGHADTLWNARLTGSKEEDIRQQFQSVLLSDEFYGGFNRIEAAYQNARKQADSTTMKLLEKQKNKLVFRMEGELVVLMKKYPTAMSTVNQVNTYLQNNLEKADSLLHIFEASSIANSGQVLYFRKQVNILKKLNEGNIAPEFSQTDTIGKMINLSSFRGKLVLIDFWASWCGPCREENANLVKVYDEYKNKGFTILSVALDEYKEQWLKAIRYDHLLWTQVSDLTGWDNAAAKQYAVSSIPTNYLLDGTGKIIARNLRGAALWEKLKQFLP
ncbi:MAG: AhpC/TSA family protein [Chitinophagaceae bacterium]|nr:AhpC/TSA family protein [Chitinophagaceae bacterium]